MDEEKKMKIHLEEDEVADVVVDGTCEFKICGSRNEEGTMKLEVLEV